VDIGCDVHEITTDTGRGSASDRFVPGTAVITASNVSGWADGTVPLEWSYFADDFARTGPALGSHWERWPVLEADHVADEFEIVAEAATVQSRPAPTSGSFTPGDCALVDTYSAVGDTATRTATIGPFPGVAPGDVVVVAFQLRAQHLDTPTIPGGWVPTLSYVNEVWQENYFQHRISDEEAATGLPWTAHWSTFAPWSWTAVAVRNAGTVTLVGGAGIIFPEATPGYFTDLVDDEFAVNTPTGGCLVARFAAGEHTHTITTTGIDEIVHSTGIWDAMQFVDVEGPLAFGTFVGLRTWPWLSPTTGAAGEGSVGEILLFVPGAPPPPASVPMEGASCARWGQDFDGDHFVDVSMTGLAAPDRVWPDASTTIELLVHAHPTDLAASVAVIEWVPAWDDPDDTGRMDWTFVHRDADGTDHTLATGHIDFDAAGFPTPAGLRFEADTAGPLRLYFGSDLIASGNDPTPPTGTQVGVYASFYAGALSYGRTHQPGPPAFTDIAGGANLAAPILLEPGVLVRIGVDHQVHGDQWFFHGYVDGIEPVYDPSARPVSRINCIDALGEIGRLPVDDIGGFDPEEAWERVIRLMNEAEWPASLRDIADDATWMTNSTAAPDREIEMLTQTAESCGGAVYGDPTNGHVVFRGRDWQVCPSTWERSWKREEMSTRVTYTSGHGDKFFNSNPEAETRFGVEPYDRTLVAIEPRIMNKLGRRQLRLRGPGAFPRVNAVLLDAATGDSAVDVMTVSTFTAPSRYLCGLHIDGVTVFDRQYLVTGVRHTITRDRWQCRLGLDIADVFATKGARWGIGHWGRTGDVWGASI
jgi:hypothetical protein